MLSDFVALIFPHLCAACDDALQRNESVICTSCRFKLPKTQFHEQDDNPVARLFWGKVPVHAATGFYHFNKGDKVQRLMHQLKYKGQPDVGIELGRIMGAALAEAEKFADVTAIIPVPLHPRRQRKRGYNQAECIAAGVAEGMKKPMDTKTLYRAVSNQTQTRKGKFERWKNVESIFQLKDPAQLENGHLLIIDDVVTTGSTLEACIMKLREIPGARVSVATLALA